ncbi:hypothetical protein [Crossiella sp. CA198]|uniref:hypothetical protein n=1 Tax=Crossiella sp. CA198 TaxID=3455607 RepID=UPI003F8D81F8
MGRSRGAAIRLVRELMSWPELHDRLAAEQSGAARGRPSPADVLSQLLNLNNAYQVPAASGLISFSAKTQGNPGGKPVPVLQVPPPPAGPPTTPYFTPSG